MYLRRVWCSAVFVGLVGYNCGEQHTLPFRICNTACSMLTYHRCDHALLHRHCNHPTLDPAVPHAGMLQDALIHSDQQGLTEAWLAEEFGYDRPPPPLRGNNQRETIAWFVDRQVGCGGRRQCCDV